MSLIKEELENRKSFLSKKFDNIKEQYQKDKIEKKDFKHKLKLVEKESYHKESVKQAGIRGRKRAKKGGFLNQMFNNAMGGGKTNIKKAPKIKDGGFGFDEGAFSFGSSKKKGKKEDDLFGGFI